MSRLILVRHAQASFFADSYDQLSPLGESQARALGEHWSRLGIAFRRSDRRPARTANQNRADCSFRLRYATQRPGPRPKSAPSSTNIASTSFSGNRSMS